MQGSDGCSEACDRVNTSTEHPPSFGHASEVSSCRCVGKREASSDRRKTLSE